MELKENFVYICFHKPNGLIGSLISLWTVGKYAHAEFVYNGYKYLSNPGGVRKEPYEYKKNHDLYELSYVVSPEKIIEFFKMTEGLPYDMKAIIKAQFLMGNDHLKDQDPDAYFCSEFVLAAIDYALNYKLMYGKVGLNEKGYFKFNPERLYKYLKNRNFINEKVR